MAGGQGEVRSRRPVVAFFVLAYVLAWAWWLPMLLAAHGWISLPWTTHVPGLVAPLVAAVVVTAATEGRAGLRDLGSRMVRWRVGVPWALVAISPLLLVVVVALVLLLFGEAPDLAALGRFDEVGDLGVVPLLVVLVVVNGFGEETGWRGYAHHHLNHGDDARRAVGIVAVLWAGWHLPLFAFHEGFQDLPLLFLPGWFLGLAAGSVLLAWLYEGSRRSVLAVAVWHGTYNWSVASDGAEGATNAAITVVVIATALVLTRRGSFAVSARPAGPRPRRRDGHPGGRPR